MEIFKQKCRENCVMNTHISFRLDLMIVKTHSPDLFCVQNRLSIFVWFLWQDSRYWGNYLKLSKSIHYRVQMVKNSCILKWITDMTLPTPWIFQYICLKNKHNHLHSHSIISPSRINSNFLVSSYHTQISSYSCSVQTKSQSRTMIYRCFIHFNKNVSFTCISITFYFIDIAPLG